MRRNHGGGLPSVQREGLAVQPGSPPYSATRPEASREFGLSGSTTAARLNATFAVRSAVLRHGLVGLALLCTTSCSLVTDPVARYINKRFPPIDLEQQQSAALSTAATALARISAPNVAFGSPTSDLAAALETDAIRQLGITDLDLRGENGLLRIEAGFDRVFEADATDSPASGALLRDLEPRVVGRVVAFVGITSSVTESTETELHLKLLPVFSSIVVDKVELGKSADVTLIGELLASVLNQYADNVTGELARSPFMDLTVPTTFGDALDPSASIHVGAGGDSAHITIEGEPVVSPVRLLGVVTMVDRDRIAAMAQLVPATSADPPAGPVAPPTFSKVKQAFWDAIDRSFQISGADSKAWMAIRKDLIAAILNDTMRQAAVCVTATGESTEQQLRNEIRFPDEGSVDCSPTRDCSPRRACDFAPCHDDRGCHKCLLHNPFGGCIQHGNDPFCEAAKAAENFRCKAEAAGKKLDCERLKEQERLSCEVEKAGEKALCETGKETLKRLARTGKFGILEAGVRARAENVRVCMKSFDLTPDLDHVRLELAIDGEAAADVAMKFTPLDIVGHLACQMPFSESRSFRASLRRSDVTVESDIRLTANATGAEARFTVEENTLPVRLQPGPTEFLLTSPNLTLACQGLNLIKPLVVGLTPFIPELRGEIDHKIKEKEVTLDVSVPDQAVGGHRVRGTVAVSPSALYLLGRVDADPSGS